MSPRPPGPKPGRKATPPRGEPSSRRGASRSGPGPQIWQPRAVCRLVLGPRGGALVRKAARNGRSLRREAAAFPRRPEITASGLDPRAAGSGQRAAARCRARAWAGRSARRGGLCAKPPAPFGNRAGRPGAVWQAAPGGEPWFLGGSAAQGCGGTRPGAPIPPMLRPSHAPAPAPALAGPVRRGRGPKKRAGGRLPTPQWGPARACRDPAPRGRPFTSPARPPDRCRVRRTSVPHRNWPAAGSCATRAWCHWCRDAPRGCCR